ncbi:MAG: glycosyltransferase family 4 protein [Alphaproteobacteria bacterium CG_4_10_14_0_8_um_filter_37_21]|nr:MAG: glycosyltransferase family 4 protein [Alphaproteobacteria bacterium CG_4_10_14_0_8_um_filter_37_21]
MFRKHNISLVISTMRSGGAERVMSKLANYFASKGHNVTLITFVPPSEKPFYTLDERITQLPLNQLNFNESKLIRLKNIVKSLFTLRSTFKKRSPDVVISFMETVNVATLLAGYKLGIPTIVSERIDPKYHILYPIKIQKLFNKLRCSLYHCASALVAQTQSALDFFPKSIQDHAVIIPNPVNTPEYKNYAVSEDVQHIIAVGRLCIQKDHVTLIKAFAKLQEKYSTLKLTIYGEGPERANLEKLILDLNLTDCIFLPGTTADIDQKLFKSDMFVFPSLYEGFPNALCEAMAIGLPVIGSDCSGNVDVIQHNDNGIIFKQKDVDGLYDQMLILVKDLSLRKHLSIQAQKISIDYSEDKIYSKWDRLLENIQKTGDQI